LIKLADAVNINIKGTVVHPDASVFLKVAGNKSSKIVLQDIQQAKEMLFDRVEEMPFENRIFNFNDDFINQMYKDAEPRIIEKIERYDKSH